jgi:hypothetical protein
MALRNYFNHEPMIPGEVHWSLQKHINLNQERVEKSFVFTTVRNIYEQLVSMWVYYAKKDKSIIGMSLEEFYFNYKNRMVPINACRQLEKLIPLNKINYICSLSRINEDIKEVCRLIGVEWKGNVSVINSTNHDDYRKYLTDKFIDFVRKEYSEDINHFGYDPYENKKRKVLKFI